MNASLYWSTINILHHKPFLQQGIASEQAPDLWKFLRFPRLGLVVIYDFVSTAVLCVMFPRKNNNTMCQKNTEPKLDSLGRSLLLTASVSQAVTDPSVSVQFACLEAELSLMTTRFIGTLYLSYLWGQPNRVGEQGLLEFIPCQGVGNALHSKGEGSDEQSD